MRGQSANADCRRAPGRHLGFTDVTLGGPFATARTRRTSQVVGCWSCISTVQVGGALSALSGIETSSLSLLAWANRRDASGSPFWFRRPRGFATAGDTEVSRPGLQLGRAGDASSPASQSGHLREPSLALTRPWSPIGFGSRQVTVLYRCGEGRTFRTVPPAPLAGLVSFPPAPFAAALSFADFAGCSRSFRRSQTAETGTDSGAPKPARQHRPRCSAYRPRPAIWPRGFARPRHQQYGARLRLSPRTSAIAVSATSFRGAALAKLADLTDTTKLV